MEIENIFNKIKNAKIDKAGLVNNTVLFVLVYLSVFYIFQIFTAIPAFTIGANMVVYASEIDFNSVNTAATDQIWESADNVINVFATPVFIEVILMLVAFLFFFKWNTERLNIRRLLFWTILCISVRIHGNYSFGHIFNLWNCNLVSDFLKITFPSKVIKYICVILSFLIVFIVFSGMSFTIKRLFNPFASNRINNLLSNIFFPVVLGSIVLLLWFIPRETKNEIFSLILFIIATSFFLCRSFVKQYRGIADEVNVIDDEKINKVPIIILLCIIPIKIVIFDRGLYIQSSPFRHFLLENGLMLLFLTIVVLTLIISVNVYRRRQKFEELKYIRYSREIDRLTSKENKEQFGVVIPSNLDKYKKRWQEDHEDIIINVNLYPNEEKRSHKLNMDKYKQRWESANKKDDIHISVFSWKNKKMLEAYKLEMASNEGNNIYLDNEECGFNIPKDMDKYKQRWESANKKSKTQLHINLYKGKDKKEIYNYEYELKEADNITIHINNEQWGFKIPKDMDKYKQRWEESHKNK